MTYESTGEVRGPLKGEWFLTEPLRSRDYQRHMEQADADYPADRNRVIMAPIVETDRELLQQAKAIADGTTSMLGTTAHVKALFAMARKLANGYYPIAHSVDPQFMRAHARDMIEYMKGHDADL